jgi:urea transporter
MDQNTIVAAVLAIINGAVAVPIVQLLKSWLHINGGFQAYLLTFVECAAVTAGYLLLAPGMTFTWTVFLVSTAYAFLQASKIYDDLLNKKPA